MRPTLFFAHANGFPAGSYRRFFAQLEADYRVLAHDRFGHDARYPVTDNWERLVDELLDSLAARCEQPVAGVGHSLGGVLTFLAALRAPERFRAVVMLDPPAYLGTAALTMRLAKRFGFIDRITPAGKSSNRRSVWPSREVACKTLGRKGLFRAFDPDCLSDYVQAATEPSADGVRLSYLPEVEVEIFRTIPHDLARQRRLQVPGAIVCARGSDVIRPRDMRRLAQRHHMTLREVDGGHMFPLERPHAAAEAVLGILREL